MARKNLDDVIHGDRSVVRSYQHKSALDDWDAWDKSKKSGSSKSDGGDRYLGGKMCFESHPPLTMPGTAFQVFGGSCSCPVVNDADIYIGFDQSMTYTARSWPWKQGTEFLFKVPDMGVPSKSDEFVKMVDWAKTQVDAGKKLHCGCIGGHGRTGMFLAALVSCYGEKEAIAYVRANYCKKAVESSTQVKFLGDHFGITPVQGSKSSSPSGDNWSIPKGNSKGGVTELKPDMFKGDEEKFHNVAGNGCIWA